MARDSGERRNKKKNKLREKKKHPYKTGGRFRTNKFKIKESKDEDKD